MYKQRSFFCRAVLGADDVCGIVEILEAVRIIQEQGVEHRSIEVLFTVAEEVYAFVAEFGFNEQIHDDEGNISSISSVENGDDLSCA